jgi:hypothetical protein
MIINGLVSWYLQADMLGFASFKPGFYFMNLLAMLRRLPTPPEEPPEAPPPLPPCMYILSAICAAELTTSCLEEPLGAFPFALCWSVKVLGI